LGPNPAAQPFTLLEANPFDQIRARTCLTMAVYYEAASQGDLGEAAVAQVVLNRLRNPLFPKTVCGVVFQGSRLPTGCQFTFTCDGSLARAPDPRGWKKAGEVAARALNGYVVASVGEATHYHTIWVVPYWQSSVEKIAQIGAHIFYRWAGPLGKPAAFGGVYAGGEPPAFNVLTIDLELNAPSSPDGPAITPAVAQHDPSPAHSAIDMTSAAQPAARPLRLALLPPVVPPKLESGPAAVRIDHTRADPASNHHLAIPASW
jgi:Cell Wall Hydrolase